ncbi:MAG: response regulator transcription factor [Actinomycetota bacterium]|nr:response regulator transcription factor [Actinomycetota bacterium]
MTKRVETVGARTRGGQVATAEVVASFYVVCERNGPPAFVEELARDPGYRAVGWADSMATALEAVRARRPDLVIADVASPERLHELVAAMPDLRHAKVVVVSSLPREGALLTAMATGVRALVDRPLRPELLHDAAAAVLAGYTFVDPRSTAWLVELALHGHRSRRASGLTFRQSQVVALAGAGLSNREIARVLDLSMDTVKSHLRQAMRRLGVGSRRAATEMAERLLRQQEDRVG